MHKSRLQPYIESVPKKMSQSFVSKHYGSEIWIFMTNNDFVFRLNPIGQYLKPNLSHPKNIHTFSQSYLDIVLSLDTNIAMNLLWKNRSFHLIELLIFAIKVAKWQNSITCQL